MLMFRPFALILVAGLLGSTPALANASCSTRGKDLNKTVECLARKVDDLESDLRRAIVIFERHHCPDGWIVLEDSKAKKLGGTFRNSNLPLVYCKKLDG